MSDEDWAAMMASRDATRVREAGRDHARRYVEVGGQGIDETQGGPTCLLTTIGRKSGKEVVTALNYLQEGDDIIVVGSLFGLDMHPHWALNLDKTPRGWVQQHERRWPVTARKLTGQERADIWPTLTAHFPLWGHFQKYADREFMVFRLSPA
jgi:deazaflavin-dependent oxidoreductase (nitroreductase family)